jgi:hypothetical protein
MLIGSSTSHILQIVTATGGSSIDFQFDVIAVSTASPPVVDGDEFQHAPPAANPITTATTTPAVTGAASLIKRVMKGSIRNNHGSVTEIVTVQKTDGSETATIIHATLLAGEALLMNEVGTWLHYDVNGGIYPSVGNAATQAEMEAGTATNKYVTPQGVNWHPGVAKAWAKHTVTGAVPQMTVTWNVTSVTDSATCRVSPVIATDFSSANYAVMANAEAATTTYSATTTSLICVIRNATLAAGGFTLDLLECDIGQATDPASWHWVAFGDQ